LVRSPGLAAASVVIKGTKGADDLGRTLEELHTKTTGNVEWNVAMHEPCTWVVGWESDDGVSTSVHSVGVATRGVVEVESDTRSGTSTVPNNPEVVTVEMDWVRKRSVVLEKPESPASTSDGKTVVVGWKRVCSVENIADGWSLPGNVNSLTVDFPEYASGSVEGKIEESWGARWSWDSGLDVWDDVRLLDTTSAQG